MTVLVRIPGIISSKPQMKRRDLVGFIYQSPQLQSTIYRMVGPDITRNTPSANIYPQIYILPSFVLINYILSFSLQITQRFSK